MERLLELAERHRDWPMPGYTHLQRAQPVYLGHHLLAYFWMLARDAHRFQFALDSAGGDAARLGRARRASTGTSTAARSPTTSASSTSAPTRSTPSRTATSCSTTCSAASICAMHLSRLGAEIVLWSSSEFGFCELDEEFSSGSSIMPQKKNPDAAELLRAKAPRVAADLRALLGAMHGLPLAYSKDLQEDKEPLFDAVDTLELCLEAAEGMLAGIEFDRERLEAASGDEMLAATDIADLLVRKGMPFREAHGVVGGLVRDASSRASALGADPRGPAAASELLDDSYYEVLRREQLARVEGSRAGPARQPSRSSSTLARETLAALRRGGRASVERRPGAAARRRVLRPLGPRGRRDLIGCTLALRRRRRRDRRDRELRARRSRLPRLRRPHRADRGPVRPARARLRLPLLRDPRC